MYTVLFIDFILLETAARSENKWRNKNSHKHK